MIKPTFSLFVVWTVLFITSKVSVSASFNFESIRLITFDAFAALLDTETSLRSHTTTTLALCVTSSQTLGFSSFAKAGKKLVDEWVSRYSALKDMSELSRMSNMHFAAGKTKFEIMLEVTLGAALQTFGLENVVDDECRSSLIHGWDTLAARNGTIETLKVIQDSKRYKLAILSNGDEKTLRALANFALKGVEFDYIFGSSEPGVFKPAPEIYRQAQFVEWDVNRVLHVAGAAFDALGAKVYGFNVVWNNDADDVFITYSGDDRFNPDHTISSIQQILPILGLDGEAQ